MFILQSHRAHVGERTKDNALPNSNYPCHAYAKEIQYEMGLMVGPLLHASHIFILL